MLHIEYSTDSTGDEGTLPTAGSKQSLSHSSLRPTPELDGAPPTTLHGYRAGEQAVGGHVTAEDGEATSCVDAQVLNLNTVAIDMSPPASSEVATGGGQKRRSEGVEEEEEAGEREGEGEGEEEGEEENREETGRGVKGGGEEGTLWVDLCEKGRSEGGGGSEGGKNFGGGDFETRSKSKRVTFAPDIVERSTKELKVPCVECAECVCVCVRVCVCVCVCVCVFRG